MRIYKGWIWGVILSVALLMPPAMAAAAEFAIGGFIKMEAIWDSTQVNKNLMQLINRNNDLNFHHGRLKFTAENTRMNFTIKGPMVFGAQTSGYIEWDFDNHGNSYIFNGAPGGGWASPHKARLELWHAMFRLNWPDTELLLGQYWSVLTEEIPETVKTIAADTTAGQPFLREPQIRLTQMFSLGGGKLTASVALAEPSNGSWGLALNGTQSALNPYGGESSETPKVEGRLKYDIDLWGKAAFWGMPRPLSVRVGAAWWRERFRSFANNAGQVFGNNDFATAAVSQRDQQYLNHWLIEGSVFIPVISTTTANLAGTASLLTQWWVGAGLDGYFEDFPATSSYLNLVSGTGAAGNPLVGDRQLLQRFGGYVQAQYYFTNQWYVNLVWGMNRAFGVDQDRWIGDTTANDPFKMNQHYYAAIWYRPIQALKFGVEYTYVRTDYFQKRTNGLVGASASSDVGENHRLMFGGFFFF